MRALEGAGGAVQKWAGAVGFPGILGRGRLQSGAAGGSKSVIMYQY